jgi:hypothetical protein
VRRRVARGQLETAGKSFFRLRHTTETEFQFGDPRPGKAKLWIEYSGLLRRLQSASQVRLRLLEIRLATQSLAVLDSCSFSFRVTAAIKVASAARPGAFRSTCLSRRSALPT